MVRQLCVSGQRVGDRLRLYPITIETRLTEICLSFVGNTLHTEVVHTTLLCACNQLIPTPWYIF